MQKSILCLLGLVALISAVSGAEKTLPIAVSAGEFDREHTIVGFRLPQKNALAFTKARDQAGREFSLQVEADGQAFFIIDKLKKGAQANYLLSDGPLDMPCWPIYVKRDQTKIKVSMMKTPLLEYQAEPSALPRPDIDPVFQRGAYLHPVFTRRGKIVTDEYPANHLHQDGIFFSWTKTEFEGRQPDFWNLKEKKGRVEFVALGKTWEGPVQGGFSSFHRFVDLTSGQPIAALNETWLARAYSAFGQPPAKSYWIFDLISTQMCAGTNALKLPKYHYGGFGFRGNWAWNGSNACNFLTSEGETDRIKGNESQARWCDIWGKLDGAEAGIAILGHPDNFRAPQPLRLHPGEPYLSFAPQQAGPFEISPGKVYVTRYRFVVHDGKPDKAELDRLWNDYAFPPEVKVEQTK